MKIVRDLISLESKRNKEWTIIVLNHFSKELVGFLSEDASEDNLQFTQRKDELGLFTEIEVDEIIKKINELNEKENMIHKTFEKTDNEDWVSVKYFEFKKAKVEFE
ncbi:hypothetical protein GVL14_15655 [Enterococcus mundtii]|nr:hypothetical protein [Enterococcus mundtii]